MSSNLRVNNILPSVGTNVAIGTAGGSITLTGGVTGSSIINTGVTTVSAGSTSAPSISPTGDSNTGIFFPAPDTVAIAEGGVEALRVDSSSNIGIGTVPKNWSGFRSLQLGGTTSIWSVEGGQAGSSFYSNNIYYDGSNRRYLTTNAASEYIQDASTGNHIFYLASSGSSGNTLSGYGEIARFTSSGLKLPSGLGIDFSATANSSGTMTSELLSDYEEGTFTPTLTGASVAGTTTYTRQDGIYTKIGRQVTVSVFMQISNATGSGTIRLGGLPFTIGSYYSQGSVMVGGYNWSGGTYLNLVAPPTANYFDVYYSGDDIGWAIQSVVNESQDWLYTVTYNV